MAIALTRRGFLQALGFGAVAAVAPALIEPRRKIWQVGADLGTRSLLLTHQADPALNGVYAVDSDDDYWARWTNRKVIGIAETEPDADGRAWVRIVSNAEAAKIEGGMFGIQGSEYPQAFPSLSEWRSILDSPDRLSALADRPIESDPHIQACIDERVRRA